jgi:hypothetical protein
MAETFRKRWFGGKFEESKFFFVFGPTHAKMQFLANNFVNVRQK